MKLWADGSTTVTCHVFETGETILTPIEFKVPVNEGEYRALITGLADALVRGIKELDVYSDSEVAIKQLHGYYKCRASNLKPLRKEVYRLASQFERVSFTWTPRDTNKAGQVLDALKRK